MLRQLVLSVVLVLSPGALATAEVIDFDELVADADGTFYPGNTYAALGVTFTSGAIPNSIAVGSVFTLAGASDGFTVFNNNLVSISPPNIAGASQVIGGPANDLLIAFANPVDSVAATTDDDPELPADVVRLLVLEPTGNPFEFRVLALAEGLDNVQSAPANLLSVNLGGASFSFALFQTTTDPEVIDDLTFTLAPVPEPSSWILGSFALAFLGFTTKSRSCLAI